MNYNSVNERKYKNADKSNLWYFLHWELVLLTCSDKVINYVQMHLHSGMRKQNMRGQSHNVIYVECE